MSDIVERLQSRAQYDGWSMEDVLCGEAASEISRLRAENEKLRAALKDAASWLQDAYFDTASEEYKEAELAALAAALKETGDE